MRLVDELKAYGCEVDGDEFLDTMADFFAEMCRDQTPDEMLTRWWDARDFSIAVVKQFRLDDDGIADEMILRRLLNMRKNPSNRLPKCVRSGPILIVKELERLGIAVDPEEFRKLILATYVSLHKDWPVERFLAHWRDAAHFCGVVSGRLHVERSRAVDNMILRTLLNLRRKGRLSQRERSVAIVARENSP